MARDLTKGSITKNLLFMAVPSMIGFGAQMLYDLIDIFWLGQLSSSAVAGVTVFSTVFWLFEALNEIIGSSSIALISQAYGKKDIERTNLAIEQTITFKFVAASIAAIILVFFLQPLMQIFVKGEAATFGMEYGYLRIFFLPIMFSSYSVNTALRCIGDARSVMKIMIFASIVNVVLDPILMFETIPWIGLPGLNMGAFGAALATIIAQSMSFVWGLYLIFSGKKGIKPSFKRLFRLDKEMSRKLLTIGLPNGLETLLRNLSGIIVLYFVSVFGESAITGVGVANKLLGFAFMPLVGLSMGGSALVGQSLGANEVDRADTASRVTGYIGSAVMLLTTVAVFLLGEEFTAIFTNDPLAINYGAQMLRYSSIGLILAGYGFGLGAAFSGSGYNMPLMVSSVVGQWAVQVPLLLITIHLLELPIYWIWLSFIFSDVAALFVKVLFYRDGKWRYRRVNG